jgi:hypothetical protein
MMSYIIGAASLIEPELDGVGVYKIHDPSGIYYLEEMPAHIRFKPITGHIALILTYRSLRSSQRSIRDCCQKGQKDCQHVLRKSSPPENRANKRAVKAVERLLWKDSVWR